MSEPLIFAVILNTNRRSETLACLGSLKQSTYSNLVVNVLDNHSTDGSIDAIHSAFPDVQVIALAANQGYAGNNNAGIAAALAQGADWVLVLNEDTILAQDCISLLVAAGERDPHVGMVGPMVYHFDEPNVIQSAGGSLNRAWEAHHLAQNEPDHGQFATLHEVEWLTGCAILVRRALIEQVGMLDERFFIYFEETEWCVRAHQAGWKLLHVPAAKIWHKGVQRQYRPQPSFFYYSTRNRFLMLAKHHAPFMAWMVAWGQTLRTLTSWTIRPKWRDKREFRDAMWQGIVDFVRGRSGMRIA